MFNNFHDALTYGVLDVHKGDTSVSLHNGYTVTEVDSDSYQVDGECWTFYVYLYEGDWVVTELNPK